MNTKQEELLPCPFCGGECKIHVSGSKASSHWFNVYCLNCNAQNQQRQTPYDAAIAWNTRIQPQAKGDVERCERCNWPIVDRLNDLIERNDRLVEALSKIYSHPKFKLLDGVQKYVEKALRGQKQ